MMTTWVIFAIIAGLASNLYNFLNRYILKDNDDSTMYGWFSEVIRIIIAFIILPFDFSFTLNFTSLGIFFLLGVIEIISIFVFMKMHANTHLSLSTIISRTRLIWVPVIMYLLFGYLLKPSEYVGILILFLGLCVVVSPHRIFVDKGVIYAYLSALILGVLAVTMKFASHYMSTSFILIGMSSMSIIFYPFMTKNPITRIKNLFHYKLKQKIIAGMANTLAMYLYVYALRIGDVSKVTAFYQAMMIVSILAGIIFLGERQDAMKKIIGALVTILGVIILTAL